MSRIRNKISSIEADDDVVTRALGLHPVNESEPLAPIAPSEDLKKVNKDEGRRDPKSSDIKDADKHKSAQISDTPPAIVSRPPPNAAYSEDVPAWPLRVSLVFAAVWIIGTLLSIMFLFGVQSISGYSAGQFGGLAFFVLFPLLLIGVVFTALKNLAGLTQQASRLESAADALMQVDETVVRRATEMSGVIKREIDTLNDGVDTALTRVTTLQTVLESETEKLGETSLAVEDKTQKIAERLSTEREALWSISNAFDEQMKNLSESLDTHSENLALSTKSAEQKIQEARLSVENTASKINQTSDLIRNNTMEAATTLTGNQEEILKLSNLLKERAGELDNIYQKHGRDLNAMIAQLQNEQEALNQSLEERLSKMRDVALSAQVSAERLTEASEAGRKTVTSLSEAASLSENAIKNRFAEMENMVKYSNQRAESISEKAARRVQDSLSQTRKEISRIELDMLNLQEKLSETSNIQNKDHREEVIDTAQLDIDETHDIEPEIPPKKSKGALKFVPLDDETESRSETENVSSSLLVAGLRPAPENSITFPQPTINIESPSALPSVSEDEDTLDLKIEDSTVSKTMIHRSIDDENISKSWWKNLFGKSEEGAQSLGRDSMTAPAPLRVTPQMAVPETKETVLPESDSAYDSFLRVLSGHGLSPNAIVDSGCIVEAVDNRIHRGTKTMSTGVAARLGEPVKLLSDLLDKDANLKNQAIDFAVHFHHSLTPHGTNSEALLEKFGTENGRLFLLCDAALNGLV